VVRAFFEGKDWDRNDEFLLKRLVVLNSRDWLPDHPFLVEDEWDVVPGRTDEGRGDLVFTDGDREYAVVEVKFIDLDGDGKRGSTKRGSNRKKRRAVEEQAMTYAKKLYDRLGPTARIEAYSYTNERNGPFLEGLVSIEGVGVTH